MVMVGMATHIDLTEAGVTTMAGAMVGTSTTLGAPQAGATTTVGEILMVLILDGITTVGIDIIDGIMEDGTDLTTTQVLEEVLVV